MCAIDRCIGTLLKLYLQWATSSSVSLYVTPGLKFLVKSSASFRVVSPLHYNDIVEDACHCSCDRSGSGHVDSCHERTTAPSLCYTISRPSYPPSKSKKVYHICRNKRPPRDKSPPEIGAHQIQWFFKGGTTQNRWLLVGDFPKGGVHKTDGFWWILQCFLLHLKIKRPGRLFRQNDVIVWGKLSCSL